MRYATRFLAYAVCSAVLITGCGDKAVPKPKADARQQADHAGHQEGDQHATAAKSDDSHDHAGWWCNEHGVPEEICALCDSKVAADFQKNGDWCKEHDRPDSQCFKCHPELEARFAAKYEARYGKKPPKPEIN